MSEYIKEYTELELPYFKDRKLVWVKHTVPFPGDCIQRKLFFGKHRGWTYQEVVEKDMSYARWLLTANIMTEQDRRYLGWLIYQKNNA